MNRKTVYRIILICVFVLDIFALYHTSVHYLAKNIPDRISLIIGEEDKIDFGMNLEVDFSEESIGVLSVDNKKLSQDNLSVAISDSVNLCGEKKGQYNANVSLFGLIGLKEIKVSVLEETKLIPGGIPVGIYIDTDGVLVLGTGEVEGRDGNTYSPATNIINSGDYILSVDNKKVTNKKELINAVQKCKKDDVVIRLRRNNEEIEVVVKRILGDDKEYKIGVWVRDNMQGIGMLTYIDENGEFAALGHGITDVDTGLLMQVDDGMIYNSTLIDIVKGSSGKPGELVGVINNNEENVFGNLKINSNNGIYGTINDNGKKRIRTILEDNEAYEAMEIALEQDIKTGYATLRTQVDDEVEEYEIYIEKLGHARSERGKDFTVTITDKRLLEKTNGIVQGMSGSPIIQDGKIIGAVTHVLVNDSTRGYGIFIENMLEY